MSAPRFTDRADAGRHLATALGRYGDRHDVVVLGLAPGGVPVAAEVARGLDAALDAFVVRPFRFSDDVRVLGAVTTGGIRVVDEALVRRLGVPDEAIEALAAPERIELTRLERAYRGDRPPPELGGRTVILVDEVLDDPVRMAAAIAAVRSDVPAHIVVAVPVGDRRACDALESSIDELLCLHKVDSVGSPSQWYADATPPGEDEIRALLDGAPRPPAAAPETFGIREVTGSAADDDALIARAADAQIVLLGEASHGTHEFYAERAAITRRLIEEAGFTAVAVEADWPDALRVDRWVNGLGDDETPAEALAGFRRFPTWMWRNEDVAAFVGWLREHNDDRPGRAARAGFYGLDLYSLHASMEAVVEYLEQVDPDAAQRARDRYSCFDHFGPDPQVYAYEAGLAGAEPCEQQAVAQLLELQRMAVRFADRDGVDEEDQRFFAEQNARLVAAAEQYYRATFRGGISSWNLRDRHMADTLEALRDHLRHTRGGAKVVVWEHNSHVGDARATELGQSGELTVGQLARERHGDDALLVGFTTFDGTVTAASAWGGDAERKRVRRALPGSWEERLHQTGTDRFVFDTAGVRGRRLERAIGVVYLPETERRSHYFHAELGRQFDLIVHIDRTEAVTPLEATSAWEAGELPETYPFGV
jgi:erythromycin esterase-like protein/predicted phosphoribosyltransferase